MSKLPEPVAWCRTEVVESCPMTFYYESHCHEDLEPLYPESAVAALQARITELEARREKDKEYLRKMDEVIDDLNVADSCINPLVDLRIAVTRLKERAEKAEAELAEARKDAPKHRFTNVSCSQCGRDFGPGNFGFSHCEDHAGESYNLGIDAAAQWLDKRADDYDSEHGITDPDTGTREYPGDGLDYISELREMADDIRGLKHTSANPGVDLAESSLAKNAERYLWLRAGNYPLKFAKAVLNDTPFGIDAAIDAAIAAGSVK